MNENNQNNDLLNRVLKHGDDINEIKTDVAVIRTLVDSLKDNFGEMKVTLQELMRRQEKTGLSLASIGLSKMIVFAGVGLVLSTFTTAFVTLIMQRIIK